MHKFSKIFLLLLAATLGVAGVASASRKHDADPKWKLHSSFDNLPRLIADTPDAVYFFVHQRPLLPSSQNRGYYDVPAAAVFIRDKQNPTAPLADLHQLALLSGNDARTFSINPADGTMLFTYSDGGIDLVSPSRQVAYIENLTRRTFPGASTINCTSYDRTGNAFWVSTNSGFVEISAADGSVIRESSWPNAVTDVNRVGDNVLAIIDGVINIAPYGKSIARISSFSPLESLTVSGTPLRVLPLSENHFAYVTDAGALYVATQAEGVWTSELKTTDTALLLDESSMVANRLESTVTLTATGYALCQGSYIYFLDSPADPAGTPGYTKQALPSGSTRFTGSYDKSEFYFYRPRGQFYTATLSDGAWSELSEPFRPDAPFTCWAYEFDYSPGNGLIATNIQQGYTMDPAFMKEASLMTAYRDGKWHNIAGRYHRPYYADENSTFAAAWENDDYYYPIPQVRGLVVDPLNPDWALIGGAQMGAAFVNVKDPRRYPIFTTVVIPHPTNTHAVSNSPFTQFKTLKDFDYSGGWAVYSNATAAGYDKDYNMWLVRSRTWGDQSIELMYLTPEDRAELYAIKNVDDLPETKWRRVHVPLYETGHYFSHATAFRHPDNFGKFVFSSQSDNRYSYIIDTKGTFDDTSDDEMQVFNLIGCPNGCEIYTDLSNKCVENPVTGQVYIVCPSSIVEIDLNCKAKNFKIPGKIVSVKSSEGMDSGVVDPIKPNTACFDEYNRLWVGTDWAGVFGVDTQTGELVAHYTTGNSLLPDNCVHGVGWDPASKSLFITTKLGMAQVWVDTPAATSTSLQAPFLTPANVTPDYTGTIAVRNVPEGMSPSVVNAEGHKIVMLPQAVSGVTHWDLRDADGKRVEPGLYRVIDPSASTDFPALTITICN